MTSSTSAFMVKMPLRPVCAIGFEPGCGFGVVALGVVAVAVVVGAGAVGTGAGAIAANAAFEGTTSSPGVSGSAIGSPCCSIGCAVCPGWAWGGADCGDRKSGGE